MNAYLRFEGVCVVQAERVENHFHARFSCLGRAYEYLILNRQAPSPLLCNFAWHVRKPLNVQAMQEAALHFLGTHDFSAFRASECQAHNPCKTISHFSVNQDDNMIRLYVASRSFLHNQVRIMVGTLKLVGQGKLEPRDVTRILETKDRTEAGPTAPAYGLYFMKAIYDS
jgi:tRNA pseudouridine38-40 synthase